LDAVDAYRVLVLGYAACGALLFLQFLGLSQSVEAARNATPGRPPLLFGLHRSRRLVFRMSTLFALDAFAGGFIIQSMIAYWFYVRFSVGMDVLGEIFFGANLIAALSALVSARIARRLGLVNTMVFTHIPSSVLLCLVPLMPTLPLAVSMLLLRFTISQMDVPTRQSFTMAVVSPDERSAAAGVTTIARSIGSSISPALTGVFLASPGLLSLPFFLAGGLKILYDLLLYRSFKRVTSPEKTDAL
jgi:predicted MFS family arabinose efflux permease